MVETLVALLMTWLACLVYLLAGYFMLTVAQPIARRAGLTLAASPCHRLSASLISVVFLVCVCSFPLRVGFGSASSFVGVLGPLISLMAAAGSVLFFLDLKRGTVAASLRPEEAVYAAVLVSLLFVISYFYVSQSVDTNYDFYYANYKAIGWALHDGNMANPLLQQWYDLRGFPAYWSYVALGGVVGDAASVFSVPLAALLSTCMAVYAIAKDFFGRKAGLASALIILASPLTFLYSYRGLDMDLLVYAAVLVAFYASLKSLKGRAGSATWGLLSGVAAGVAMMADPKGFIVLLILPVSLALSWAMRQGGPRPRAALLWFLGASPALAWTALFGYLQVYLHPVHALVQLPPTGPGWAPSNLVNVFYAMTGLLSYPFYAFPLALLAFLAAATVLVALREPHIAQLLAFALVVIASVFAFAGGGIGVDNWRYFYLTVPVLAILMALALERIAGGEWLVPASAVFSAAYVSTLIGTAIGFNASSFWFANTVRGMSAWVDPAIVPWSVSSALMAVAYLVLKSSRGEAVRLRIRALAPTGGGRNLAWGVLGLVLISLVVAPFLPTIQGTALADISQVRDTGPTWNLGLRAPFGYIATSHSMFQGSAFITFEAYGIEYYAGVPSLDLSQPAQAAPLLPYINDSAALRSFLLSHGIRFALFPKVSNTANEVGPDFLSLEVSTRVGALVGNATILKVWDGWALYTLAQG